MSTMTEEAKEQSIKLTVEVLDSTRRGLASYAGLHNMTIGQVIDLIASRQIPEQIDAARRAIGAGEPAKRTKPGRKPRP